MLIAGWKPFSLVDVVGRITFTTWACGCNLKCPFCHNWKVAEWQGCFEIPLEKFREELRDAKGFVDYLHLTGGEPALQPKLVKELSKISREEGVEFSLNTNCTVPASYELIDLADHVATDVKMPFEPLYGVNGNAKVFFENFRRCLNKLAQSRKPVELRIPVAKGLTMNYLDEIKRMVDIFDREKTVIVVNPLVTEPLTDPRDKAWCSEHCYKGNMPEEEAKEWERAFKEMGFKVKVKRWINE